MRGQSLVEVLACLGLVVAIGIAMKMAKYEGMISTLFQHFSQNVERAFPFVRETQP